MTCEPSTTDPSGARKRLPTRFVLVGGSFTNKGAEAMVITTVEQVLARFPGAHIAVASYVAGERPPQRNRRITGTHATHFDYLHNKKDWKKPLKVCALALPVPRSASRAFFARDGYLEAMANADVVLDISGFAFSDQRPFRRVLLYVLEIISARLNGVPFIAMTQAFGPFTGLTKALARYVLPLANTVVARDRSSVKHLETIGVRGYHLHADMAYLFRGEEPVIGRGILYASGAPEGRLRFGIVPNINLYYRSTGTEKGSTYVHGLVKLAQLAAEVGALPVFVCHEARLGHHDDEWLARTAITAAGLDEYAVVTAEHTAAELKSVIRCLDFVVASRFHAVVAAISTATPFLAVGWSHKYDELVRDAGEPDGVLDGRTTTAEQWVRRARERWNTRDMIRNRLAPRLPELRASASGAFDLLERHVTTTPRTPALEHP